MKKLYLVFSMLIFGLIQLNAQCPATATAVNCGEGPVAFAPGAASQCVGTPACGTLHSEYIIVNTADTVILGSTTTLDFDPTLYEGYCVSVQPVCYDIQVIKNFVDAMESSLFDICCTSVNDNTPAGLDPICTAINQTLGYTSGDQIQDLTQVFDILGAFGADTLTVIGLASIIDTINLQAPTIGVVCSGVGVIDYCIDRDIDFSINAFDICPPPPGCEDVINITGLSEVNANANISVISEGMVPAGRNVTYQAGTDILLNAGFEVQLNAEFQAVIGPCVPLAPLNGSAPQQRAARQK